MDINWLWMTTMLLGLMVFVFWFLLYRMIDRIMDKQRINKTTRMIVDILLSILVLFVLRISYSSAIVYAVLFLLLFVGFILFYNDRFGQVLFCTGACILNLLSIRTIAIGITSYATGQPILNIEQSPFLFMSYLTLAFALTNIAMIIVTHFVPLTFIRVINKHKEQLWFLLGWMIINIGYLFIDVSIIERSTSNLANPGNGIIASICILTGFYIVLFFAITTSSLLGYKEKNRELEQVLIQEQRFRNSITKDAIATYEVNVTKNLILGGFEERLDELGDSALDYSEMIAYMADKLVYLEDVEEFKKYANSENLCKLFDTGKSETSIDYRRLIENEKYVWVSGAVNLVRNENSGDLIAFFCIKNIDEQKRHQLDLEYKAQRDMLTGLYNKEITGSLINEHLTSNNNVTNAMLFMIDVDNFKAINDNLGHVFGDAVLCELADKLRKIFHEDDIVGRIGGDEFIAYMKDCDSIDIADRLAAEILKQFEITYDGLRGGGYTISGSVGISMFPCDGSSFEELFKTADAALYKAKRKGKNTYEVYDGSGFVGYQSNRTEINDDRDVPQINFRQNRVEYVFKMLYQSDNSSEAIRSVLELVTRHFSFERGYIFETSNDGTTTSNSFEWCAPGITPQIDTLQQVPIEAVATANSHFYESGTFILKSLDELQPNERKVLEPQGIKSMFQFGIFDKRRLLGFIGFDNCMNEEIPSNSEIDEIAIICNILATFFVKQRIDEVTSMDIKSRIEVMEHLDSYIYVVDMESFEVLFMNEKTKEILYDDTGQKAVCYSFFRGQEHQCDDCPMRQMNGDSSQHIMCDLYNDKLNIWTQTRASTLRWMDGRNACLIECTDITKQKSLQLLQINELEQLAYKDEITGGRTFNKFKEDARMILKEEVDLLHLLVKIDIKDFKIMNQMDGFEKGDEILYCIGRAIEETLRTPKEIYSRIHNDEFVVMFTIQDANEITEMYENFLQTANTLLVKNGLSDVFFYYGHYIVQPKEINHKDIMDMLGKLNIAHKTAKLNKTAFYTSDDTDFS